MAMTIIPMVKLPESSRLGLPTALMALKWLGSWLKTATVGQMVTIKKSGPVVYQLGSCLESCQHLLV
jgi:hypothetical protein